MEIGNHIKKYRNDLGLSQDELAQKVYVSRQTISNWENDKSYPDIESLSLLSEIFGVSIDILVRGDIGKMKERINEVDRKEFERLGNIFSVLFIIVIVSIIPFVYFLNNIGILMWIMLYIITMYFAVKVEKFKKQFDIQTYREIIAFTEGQSLDEISKARESGKRPYQKAMLVVATAFITVIVTMVMMWIFGLM